MPRRLCNEDVLRKAIQGRAVGANGSTRTIVKLFASVLLRSRRSENLFAVVGIEGEGRATGSCYLAAMAAEVGSVSQERITLYKCRLSNNWDILKWFLKATAAKREQRYIELDENVLRFLACQEFPGSLFYDIFVDETIHIFSALPDFIEPMKKIAAETIAAETIQESA